MQIIGIHAPRMVKQNTCNQQHICGGSWQKHFFLSTTKAVLICIFPNQGNMLVKLQSNCVLIHSLIHNYLLSFFFILVFIWVIWFHCWEKQDLLKAEWTNTMLNSLYMQQLHALIHQAMSLLPICTLLHVILQSQAQRGKVECDQFKHHLSWTIWHVWMCLTDHNMHQENLIHIS